MQTTKNLRRTLLILSVTLAGTAWADYQIIDLGRIDGATPSGITPQAINNDGVIVGSMYTATGLVHGASYDGTQITDLAAFKAAVDINNSGYIVGIDTYGRSLILNNYVPTYLGSLGGATPTSSNASSINDNGEVVGTSPLSTDPYSAEHAFLYSNGSMIDLGTFGGTTSVARGINNYGVVVGYAHTAGNSQIHAFTYSGGVKTDLGTLGGFYSAAQAINDSGQVVGDSILASNTDRHAFLYDGGAMTDLGTLGGDFSAALSINNNGDVIGYSTLTIGGVNTAPFLYSNGVMVDLNTLLPANSGWILQGARDINDYGQIVGDGTLNGVRHGYLLSPGC